MSFQLLLEDWQGSSILDRGGKIIYIYKLSLTVQRFKTTTTNNKKLFLTLKINQHIRMISEGSCDTEDWSNDAENSALHHRNTLYLKEYSNRKLFYCNNISWYYWFFCIFDQINAALVSITTSLKTLKILLIPNLWIFTCVFE